MDRIMRLFGYENINNIKIQEKFKMKPPKYEKLLSKKLYHIQHHRFEQPIVLDRFNWLIDGYTTYLIAKEMGKRYVKIRRR